MQMNPKVLLAGSIAVDYILKTPTKFHECLQIDRDQSGVRVDGRQPDRAFWRNGREHQLQFRSPRSAALCAVARGERFWRVRVRAAPRFPLSDAPLGHHRGRRDCSMLYL